MLRVGHLEAEPADRHPVAGGGDRRGEDVHPLVGEHPGDVGEQLVPVERLDLDGDQEHRAGRAGPLDLDQPLRLALEVLGVGAVVAVHADPAGAGDEAEDLVARHRGAAPGQLDPDVAHAVDDDARVAAGRRRGRRPGGDRGLGDVLDRALVAADGR